MPARRPPFPFSATPGIVLGAGGPGRRLPEDRAFSPAEELAVAMGGESYPMDEISAARILAVVGRDRAGHE